MIAVLKWVKVLFVRDYEREGLIKTGKNSTSKLALPRGIEPLLPP